MKSSFRRVSSALALTALAASMAACQASSGFAPGAMGPRPLNAATNVRSASAPRSASGASLAEATRLGLPAVPGEFLVKLRPGASAQSLITRGTTGVQTKPVGNSRSGLALYKTAAVRNPGADAQTLQTLRSNPAVLYAEPNYIVRLKLPANEPQAPQGPVAAAKPNDPMFDKQYHHKNIDTLKGWSIEQGKADMILAIVDTGVDLKHPDLAAKLLPGYNTVDDSPIVEDGNGHGTHCAGIAAALTNNGVGVAGVAPNVKILPVQVLSKEGSGSYASVAGGIIWAADHGAKVISMSLGGSQSSPVITEAVKYAISKDALLVAAMGNDGAGPNGDRPIIGYPAAEAGVMAVSASDSADKRARFSQVGKWNSVIAPGVDILATFPTYATDMPGIGYGAISGTSMATPAVAGLAALVRSKFPQLNQAQVKSHIEATSDDLGAPGYDIQFGFGRINVGKALSTAPGAVRR